MSDRQTPKTTEYRRPHTIYVTDQLWDAIERRHLELRLASSAPESKIDFVEQVIRAGLDSLASAAPKRQPVRPSRAHSVVEHAKRSAPEASTGILREPQREPIRQPQRRQSAFERLKQASEPGRPAPIPSAAGELQPAKEREGR